MIRPPRRAVTRFLIPFIDVLILLFCIFLLMPFVSRPDNSEEVTDSVGGKIDDRSQLRFELDSARGTIESLKQQLQNPLATIQFQWLEIDKTTGKLFVTGTRKDDRNEIADAAQAAQFIASARVRSRPNDAGFLLLFPRELTGFPLRHQVESYRKWFQGTPHAFAASQP